MAIDLYGKAEFLSAMRSPKKPVAFVVGSPLSFEGDRGVPGIGPMLEFIREEIGPANTSDLERFEQAIAAASGANRYQSAMRWLHANRGQDAVNHVVQRAVLKARLTPMGGGPVETGKPEDWYIPTGTRGLAKLVCSTDPKYHGPILTTNFDPLLSLAIRAEGRTPRAYILTADGGCRN